MSLTSYRAAPPRDYCRRLLCQGSVFVQGMIWPPKSSRDHCEKPVLSKRALKERYPANTPDRSYQKRDVGTFWKSSIAISRRNVNSGCQVFGCAREAPPVSRSGPHHPGEREAHLMAGGELPVSGAALVDAYHARDLRIVRAEAVLLASVANAQWMFTLMVQ